MEEIKPPQSTGIEAPVPPPRAPSQPSHSLPPLPPKTKKRPLDTNAFLHYSKMRAVIRDLRPHFIEVLKTPDFRNGKAAKDIREKIKLLQDLYILMVTTTQKVYTSRRLVTCSMVSPCASITKIDDPTMVKRRRISHQVMPQKSSGQMMAKYQGPIFLADRHLAGILSPSQVPNRFTMELLRKYFEKKIPLFHQNHDLEHS